MKIFTDVQDIDQECWDRLVKTSQVATWFQAREAFDFFNSLPFIEAFVIAVESDEAVLKGVLVGYIQKDGGKIKQFLSRRAIVTGGPLLAENITDDELRTLLYTLKHHIGKKTIYIETRNFNDYSRWRNAFEECGYEYQPHLNFHLNTESLELAQSNIRKHRWKYIRLSLRDGAKLVERPNIEQVKQFYSILAELYKTKVKKPLFPWSFFERLYGLENAKFFLVEYDGEIVGGSVCMCLEGRTLYEWMKCGSEHLYKNIRPSSVSTWFGIKYAAENGFKRYDFMGAGKPGQPYGVRDFKAEFGGKQVEHGRYHYVANRILYMLGTLAVKIIKKK